MSKISSKIKLIFLALVIIFFNVHPALPSQITLSKIELNIHDATHNNDELKSMIPFYEGQIIDENEIPEIIKKIKNLNIFKKVHYELIPISHNKFKLILELTQAKKIRGLGVRGNYPFLSKNIKKLVPLQPGTQFDESLIPSSIEAVKKYLKKYGYYHSQVRIHVKPVKKYNNVVDIVIRLKRGKKYRVGKINITGNKVINTNRIRNKISTFARFRMVRFKKDLKNIKKLYARKGYIKARVKLEKLTFNENTRKVDISISIRENKKLKILIAGKTFFSRSRLKKITQLEERRSYDRFAIKNGTYRLERYFRKNGYPDVEVTSEVIKPKKNEVIAKYTLMPGTRVELKKIKFENNREFSAKKLKKQLASIQSGLFSRSFYYEKLLLKDRVRLRKFYLEQGFFDSKIDDPLVETNKFGDQKEVLFPIYEGDEYTITNIEIVSDLPVNQELILKKLPLKIEKPFNKIRIQRAKNRILDILHEEGYAYAEVVVQTNVKHENHTVDIKFQIVRGDKIYVRSIMIEGNLITREKTIRKNLKIKSGDFFEYQKMLDAQLNLRRLGIFSSVRIVPLGFDARNKQIDLFVNVIERKSFIVKIQGGFDSRHLATGELSFTKLNLFGTGRQFILRGIAGPKFNRGEMTFFSPRIFGASWNLANQYFIQYEDEPNFIATSYGGFINTLKNFGPHWTFGFKEQIIRTEVDESRSNVQALGNSLFDNTFNEFQLTGILDYRDNFSDPQKGVYILARNEFNTDLANLKNNFNTFEFNISQYQGFFKRFTLVNTFRYGQIFKVTSSPRIPVNKLFFLGGADTLRGFTEDGVNPAGGKVMLIYNAELQLRIAGNFKIAGFFDAGSLTNSLSSVTFNTIRESAGVGLRYFTPIGPLRLDWGFILDRRPGEPTSRLHFSFGYFF